MNRMLFYALGFCCLNSLGQTKFPSSSAKLLSVPCPTLRAMVAGKETPAGAVADEKSDGPNSETQYSQPNTSLALDSSGSNRGPSPEPMSAETRERAIMLRYHERLERGGYLTRPEPPSENPLVRFAESTFRPELLKIGKASVSCSIVTAIKRKNPLCLLNPIVLNLSW